MILITHKPHLFATSAGNCIHKCYLPSGRRKQTLEWRNRSSRAKMHLYAWWEAFMTSDHYQLIGVNFPRQEITKLTFRALALRQTSIILLTVEIWPLWKCFMVNFSVSPPDSVSSFDNHYASWFHVLLSFVCFSLFCFSSFCCCCFLCFLSTNCISLFLPRKT